MFRRATSVLLLPGVLLAQAAAPAHSHGGTKPAGHDLRPHVHVGSGHERRHHHRHSHGHHHGSRGHRHDAANVSDEAPASPQQDPATGHEDDAVYVAAYAALAARPPDAAGAKGGSLEVALWVSVAEVTLSGHALGIIPWAHPPPAAATATPLYIRHLALLI